MNVMPGAADFGDFDPTSSTIALEPAQALDALPPAVLAATFDSAWANFQRRHDEKTQEIYTSRHARMSLPTGTWRPGGRWNGTNGARRPPVMWARAPQGMTARGIHTWWGTFDFTARSVGRAVRYSVSGLHASRVEVCAPFGAVPSAVRVNGKPTQMQDGRAVVVSAPAVVEFEY